MDIKALIESTLNIPVIDLSEPLLYPCATWYKSLEETELSGDGDETESSDTYEIDIWCEERDLSETYSKQLKKAIALFDYFTIPYVQISYDTNGKAWRANLNFKYIKSS